MGSTGSIGRQTLDIISEYPDKFTPYLLTANSSVELLAEQARKFNPRYVIIANKQNYEMLRNALADVDTTVLAGAEAITDAMSDPDIHTVVTAMVGYAGLSPTINAIKHDKNIALANKETLVVAGDLINRLLKESDSKLYPVDSEHGAIWQCLAGEKHDDIYKLILTASGGPFRTKSKEELAHVTKEDALRHPNWNMGAKITIASATMMNKGFEVMEARWLFRVEADRIQVLIHPQSVVHSGVQFKDGAVKAQLGVPDMRLPIQYAFSYPERLSLDGDRLDLFKVGHLDFFEPDMSKFRCLQLAYEAIRRGGNMPCILNAANEVVNLAFREDRCSFLQMPDIIGQVMQRADFDASPNLDVYLQTDAQARKIASEILG